MKKYYSIQYGNPEIGIKTFMFGDLESANKMFKKLKHYAEKCNVNWIISMWGLDGSLIESITVNPTMIHKGNF